MDRFELPLDQIIQGDCLEVLKTLPENSIDLVFADPPYNLQLQQELWRPNMTRVDGVTDEWDRFGSFAEYDSFTRAWLSACRRVMKDTGTLWVIGTYHNIYRVGAILQDLDFWILNDVIWLKSNPMPNFRGVRFTNAHETLIWAQKIRRAPYTFNYHAMKALNDDLQMRSDWLLPICSGKERLKVDGSKAHPTQKPEALLYRVVLASSRPEEVILDPFLGSGTTGVIARKLGRHWIGIERDPINVQLAKDRLDRSPSAALPEHLHLPETRKDLKRIPFGALLECGLLQPGQELFWGARGDIRARILPDGHLRYIDQVGSIHSLGKIIQDAPCNGWEHWYYQDEETGQRFPIDRLRQLVRDADSANTSDGEKTS
jgi:DNA modification methylase